jgi:hypothetical protein
MADIMAHDIVEPPANAQDPVIRMLDEIRQAGFDGIGGLLMRMMESRHENVKRRVSHLVDSPAAEKFVGLVVKRGRLQNRPDDSDIVKIVVAKMTREAEAIRRDKQCHIGAKGVTPEFINAFSFQSLGLRYAELAPSLWLTICALGDVDMTKAKEYLQAPPEDVAHLEDFDGEDDDDDAEEGAGATTPKKKMKDKVLAVITAIAGIVFTRSRNCNASQMMLGYYLFATRTGKRVMGVLNHLGICTSYDTVRRALQGNAEKVQALIIKRSRQDPIALTYDNLTNKHNAASETLLNKSSMLCFTAAGVIFLKLTPSLARRLGKDVEHPAPEKPIPGQPRSRAGQAAQSDKKPGLRLDQLLLPDPEWSSLKPGDIVNVQSDQKYFAPIAKALVCRVIKKFFPKELKCSEDECGISPFDMPELYKVAPGRSDIQTLATLQIDESTIDGNLAVLESLATDQLGMTLEELAEGRMIPVSGDQMTVARISSGQFLRIRDFKEHQMLWAKTLAGMLHTRMAMIHAIYLSHPGRRDGRDPASLSKFVKLLGRTKIKEKCLNLNASHELLTQVCEGHVLAALIERTGAGGFEGLRAKIASGEWREALNSMVDDDWLRLNYVDRLRGDARQAAEAATADTEPVTGESVKQTQARIKKATTAAEMEKRDVVFENALLFMLQALIYTDYHTSLRCGDTGRLERSSDMLCVMFQGLSKLKNYRQLSLDFKACREKEWTKEMHELWL